MANLSVIDEILKDAYLLKSVHFATAKAFPKWKAIVDVPSARERADLDRMKRRMDKKWN